MIIINERNLNKTKKRYLCVTYNGKYFESKSGKKVFVETLMEIGLERIPEVGIMCSGYNLVDTRKREDGVTRTTANGSTNWQEKVGGLWVYIILSNPAKAKILLQIARHHNLDIRIEAKNEI